MRIAVCLTCPPRAYSGGRYGALSIAELIAMAGHETHVITNNRPVLFDEFRSFPAHDKVTLHVTPNFRRGLPDGSFDLVLLVPGGAIPGYYDRVILFAADRGAALALLNFESGNWFNAVSSTPRPLNAWDPWRKAARYASLILSISLEGNRWAQHFYTDLAPNTRFESCYPAINRYIADKVPQPEREDRVIIFMRFATSEHKGSRDLEKLFDESLRGRTLVFVLGLGDLPPETEKNLADLGERYGVAIEYRSQITDRDKFTELKRARLMLFPSLFEGFGYPPVEALYCGTPCVAFDLPVLHETCGDALVFAEHGDWENFRARMREALSTDGDTDALRDQVRAVTDYDTTARELDTLLQQTREAFTASPRASVESLRVRDTFCMNDFKLRLRSIVARLTLKLKSIHADNDR